MISWIWEEFLDLREISINLDNFKIYAVYQVQYVSFDNSFNSFDSLEQCKTVYTARARSGIYVHFMKSRKTVWISWNVTEILTFRQNDTFWHKTVSF